MLLLFGNSATPIFGSNIVVFKHRAVFVGKQTAFIHAFIIQQLLNTASFVSISMFYDLKLCLHQVMIKFVK